jgi:hypothetical protein
MPCFPAFSVQGGSLKQLWNNCLACLEILAAGFLRRPFARAGIRSFAPIHRESYLIIHQIPQHKASILIYRDGLNRTGLVLSVQAAYRLRYAGRT